MYQKNKAKYTREKEDYESQYGEVPIKRKKTKAKWSFLFGLIHS